MTEKRKPREFWLRVATGCAVRCGHASPGDAKECFNGQPNEEVVHVREVLSEEVTDGDS